MMKIVLLSLSLVNFCFLQSGSPYVNIYAHGLTTNATASTRYKHYVGGEFVAQDGPEWHHGHADQAGTLQSCLGQLGDILVVADQLKPYRNSDKKIILSGASKGAATIINTVGFLAAYEPSLLRGLAAVIVDSPFDTIGRVAVSLASSVGYSLGGQTWATIAEMLASNRYAQWLVPPLTKRGFCNYDPEDIVPLTSVQELWRYVDKNVVVVFVHSQEDAIISVDASRTLYIELKKQGFNNLYFIETEQGEHVDALWGPQGEEVFEKLCYIYTHHNLPLPEHLTDLFLIEMLERFEEVGATILAELKPSIEAVEARITPVVEISELVRAGYRRLLGYAQDAKNASRRINWRRVSAVSGLS